MTRPLDLRIAAATIEKTIGPDSDADLLATFGTAQLLLGSTSEAIDTLSDAVALDPGHGSAWNDLAAAFLAEAAAQPVADSHRFVQALDAAARAVRLEPDLEEAWFNRALAAQQILPAADAAAAWTAYLDREDDRAWAEEARRHVTRAATQEEPLQRDALTNAITRRDATELVKLARRDPQQFREYIQDDLLPAWGEAEDAHDTASANAHLASATMLASLLGEVTGDRLLEATCRQLALLNREKDSSSRARREAAAGHRAYGDGVRAYGREDREQAEASFARARAAFAASDSAFLGWAEVQLAVVAYRRRDLAATARYLDAASIANQRVSGRALQARIHWMRAFIATQTNQIDRSLAEYTAAANIYAQLGERQNELAVHTGVSDNLRLFGDRAGAWEHLSRTSTGSAALRDPVRRYLALYNATLLALDEELADAALLLQNSAVRAAEAARTPAALPEALATRASIHVRLGQSEAALRDIAAAVEAARRLTTSNRAYFDATLDAIKGQVLADRQPREALESLGRAAVFFANAEPGQYGRLLLESGRLKLGLTRVDEARRDLEAGIINFEERRLGIRDRAMRVSYTDKAWALFNELIELDLRDPDGAPKAFDHAERSRARSMSEHAMPRTLPRFDQLSQALPRGVAAVVFKATTTRLLCWVITAEAARLVPLQVSLTSLERQGRLLRQALTDTDRPEEIQQLSEQLYDALIAPLPLAPGVGTLALVLDNPLHGIPFAALRERASQRFLIERYTLLEAPSVTVLLRDDLPTGRRSAVGDPFRSVLLVGAPTLNSERFNALPPLPAAKEEVDALAAVYPGAQVLAAEAARRGRFLEELAAHRIVHFAGHAVPNPVYPAFSLLALAPDRPGQDSGAVFAHEIEQLPLHDVDLVVLAACDTGRGTVSQSEGPLSLARAFLVAGVPRVVASLWRVEDDSTADLLRLFHQQLRAGHAPAVALRRAQLEFVSGADVWKRHPSRWAAFSVFGTLR